MCIGAVVVAIYRHQISNMFAIIKVKTVRPRVSAPAPSMPERNYSQWFSQLSCRTTTSHHTAPRGSSTTKLYQNKHVTVFCTN